MSAASTSAKPNNVKLSACENVQRSSKHHYTFDGYGINAERLNDRNILDGVLDFVNRTHFDGKGKPQVIEINGTLSFDPLDYGLLGYIAGQDKHFFCRTYIYFDLVVVDCRLGDGAVEKQQLTSCLLKAYAPSRHVHCCDRTSSGRLGKQVVFKRYSSLDCFAAEDKLSIIRAKLKLRPIGERTSDMRDENDYDYFVPLLEGFMAIHANMNGVELHFFSRKNFDPVAVRRIFGGEACYFVQRGSALDIIPGPQFTPEQIWCQPITPTCTPTRAMRGSNASTGGGLKAVE